MMDAELRAVSIARIDGSKDRQDSMHIRMLHDDLLDALSGGSLGRILGVPVDEHDQKESLCL